MPNQKSYPKCKTWRFRKERFRLWRRSSWWPSWKSIIALASGLMVFVVALVAALSLAKFAVDNFGWDRTSLFLLAYLIGNICDQAKDVASRFTRSAQEQTDVLRDVSRAFKEAWNDENSAEFLYRSLKWGALAGAGQLLSQMLAPNVPMGGD